ncbi:MAG: LeuD/DmdB family oxidoreductase small subunit [Thermoplasmataceae archaeon]
MSRVFILGDDVDTDAIAPGGYLHLPLEEQKKHCLESVVKDFAGSVKDGDLIVAGENFGSGSSREQAPLLLKALGIKAVFAKSFSRLFYRNAINVGLFPGTIKGTCGFRNMEEVHFQMEANRIISQNSELDIVGPQGIALEILEAGGMIDYARKLITRD